MAELFDIRFKAGDEERVFDIDATRGCEGRIKIGEFWESFFVSTHTWSAVDYEVSWSENLRALRSGHDAFFVTDVGQEGAELLFRCWPAFHHDGLVLFTEKLLLRSLARGKTGAQHVPELINFGQLRQAVGTGVSFWKLPSTRI